MSTSQLAKFVAYFNPPADVAERAKLCIMDTIGVMLAGLNTKAASIVRQLVESRGGAQESSLFGTNTKVPVPQATHANGVAAFALDLDDGHIRGGHPGAAIIPAALAVAEFKGSSGKNFITGVVAGYEVGIRATVKLVEQEKSFGHPFPATGAPYHSAGTGGAYGAAAAAAYLLGCDEHQIENAIGIASAYTPCTRPFQIQSRGHMAKECVGWGTFCGVEAAFLAKQGFTGPGSLFDDEGVSFDASKFEILDGYFKPYPACRYTHPAIDATLKLVREFSITPEKVRKVTVVTRPSYIALNSLEPVSIEQAQYSFPFVVGAALAYGKYDHTLMVEEKLKDPVILAQARKVEMAADPTIGPKDRSAEVRIETVQGRIHSVRVQIPKGHPKNPMTKEELEAKFLQLGGRGAEKNLEIIQKLEILDDIRILAENLRGLKQ